MERHGLLTDFIQRVKMLYFQIDKSGNALTSPRTYEEIKKFVGNFGFGLPLEELITRDYKDSTRDHSPLQKADDALEIDTTHLTINEVINKIVNTVNQKRTLH